MLYVEPHPSGAGFWLQVDAGEEFKLTREVHIEEGEVVVATGVLEHQQVWLDYGFSPRGTTIYRYYNKDSSGAWVRRQELSPKPNPQMWWNPFGCPQLQAVKDPRDAMIVFFATRLAALTKQGNIQVNNPNHKTVFPVVVGYGFDTPHLPMVSAHYNNGASAMTDCGSGVMEEVLNIRLNLIAESQFELDQVARAIRGVLPELNLFLYSLDCHNVQYGNMQQGTSAQMEGEAIVLTVYQATFDISFTSFSFAGYNDPARWKLLPSWTLEAGTYTMKHPLAPLTGIITANGYHEQDDRAYASVFATGKL
jgi:hypothetical protein